MLHNVEEDSSASKNHHLPFTQPHVIPNLNDYFFLEQLSHF